MYVDPLCDQVLMAGKAEEFGDDDSRPFRFGSFWKA